MTITKSQIEEAKKVIKLEYDTVEATVLVNYFSNFLSALEEAQEEIEELYSQIKSLKDEPTIKMTLSKLEAFTGDFTSLQNSFNEKLRKLERELEYEQAFSGSLVLKEKLSRYEEALKFYRDADYTSFEFECISGGKAKEALEGK